MKLHWLILEDPRGTLSALIHDVPCLCSAVLIDLGFENYGYLPGERTKLHAAIETDGIRIPESRYMIRMAKTGGISVELANGNLPTLPDWWLQAVYALDANDRLVWMGHRVRKDQIEGMNKSQLQQHYPDGVGT